MGTSRGAAAAKDKLNDSDDSDESFFKKYMWVFIAVAIVVVCLCCGCIIAGALFFALSQKDDDSSDDSRSSRSSRSPRSSRSESCSTRDDSFSDGSSHFD